MIVDARPRANAIANMAKGGGFEDSGQYNNVPVHFCDIQNIHAMRNSLAELENLCNDAAPAPSPQGYPPGVLVCCSRHAPEHVRCPPHELDGAHTHTELSSLSGCVVCVCGFCRVVL